MHIYIHVYIYICIHIYIYIHTHTHKNVPFASASPWLRSDVYACLRCAPLLPLVETLSYLNQTGPTSLWVPSEKPYVEFVGVP